MIFTVSCVTDPDDLNSRTAPASMRLVSSPSTVGVDPSNVTLAWPDDPWILTWITATFSPRATLVTVSATRVPVASDLEGHDGGS